MKAIIVILIVFFTSWVMAGTELPSIHNSEIEALQAVCCVQVEGPDVMCFFNHAKTLVIAYLHQRPQAISYYYYIDKDELIGFKLDIKPFMATGRKDYIPVDIDDDSAEWYKKALDWMNSYPVFEPKPEADKNSEYSL